MKEAISTESPKTPERLRPGLNSETDENQLISLSVDAAKKVLSDYLEGKEKKIPTSIILMYGKLATTNDRIERETMAIQQELMLAKKQALESQAKVEELYAQAMRAFQRYGGYDEVPEEEVY